MAKDRLQDYFAGHDGAGYVTLNGSIVPAFSIAKITAKLEPVVENKQLLGTNMTQNAVRGLKGTGDLSYYHTTDAFIKAMRTYKNGGAFPDIKIQFYSDSASSQYDRIEVTLSNVIFASVGLGSVDDSSSDAQKLDTSFTFDDFDLV